MCVLLKSGREPSLRAKGEIGTLLNERNTLNSIPEMGTKKGRKWTSARIAQEKKVPVENTDSRTGRPLISRHEKGGKKKSRLPIGFLGGTCLNSAQVMEDKEAC